MVGGKLFKFRLLQFFQPFLPFHLSSPTHPIEGNTTACLIRNEQAILVLLSLALLQNCLDWL